MYRLLVRCLIVFVVLALGTAPAAAGRIHALVIGIDDYQSRGGALPDLRGAVNDARDIAAALRERGAAEVRVLLNGDAHRDAIFENWYALKARARPGDTLLLSFAGHGAQEPERIPGSEADGLDEVTVLGGFRPDAPHNYQRIFDYEWRRLVAEAGDYRVILVFDACHSGTMNRPLQLPELPTRLRFGEYGTIDQDTVPLPMPGELSGAPPGTLAHETYIGATLDEQVAIELKLDGQWRGALSYFFARALRGAADLNGDGRLTRSELRRYIQENVRITTDQRQEASVQYAGSGEATLFGTVRWQAPIRRESGRVGLELADASDNLRERIFQRLPEFVEPAERDDADLIWKQGSAYLVSGLGDRVADLEYALNAHFDDFPALRGALEKWSVLPLIRGLSADRPLRLRLRKGETMDRGDELHRDGERLTLVVDAATHPYLTVFNLASTGEVQYLYPLAEFNDAPRLVPGTIFTLPAPFTVRAPYGADHLVVLTSRRQPLSLQEALQDMHDQRRPRAALEALQATLSEDGTGHELGVLGLFTAPAGER